MYCECGKEPSVAIKLPDISQRLMGFESAQPYGID
jgi:hypothetical protein